MGRQSHGFGAVVGLVLLLGGVPLVGAQAQQAADTQAQAEDTDKIDPIQRLIALRERLAAENDARALTDRGAKYLVASQEQDGGWISPSGPGVTALVLKALIQDPSVSPQHPSIKRGLAFIERYVQEDGGIYGRGGLHKNYESSVVLSMLSVLDDSRHAERKQQLVDFITKLQWDAGEDVSESNPFYGGAGYGRGKRPDLSNTNLMVAALHDSGLPPEHPAYKRALVFIERCQMLGEHNDMAFADGSTQGGFIYSPANNGESKAGTFSVKGREELRAYGSMTYAGLKSMIYAGLSKEDPRVQAAVGWIKDHWTLEQNPNMPPEQGGEGLYYYYHTFARALDAFGADLIKTRDGETRDWRVELVKELAERQRSDGSWVNDEDRWMEGMPPLTTAYCMLALQAAYPDEPAQPTRGQQSR
jgi:squalene-hopene/tetraprenyl-beta-curcumene cyclase